jgi:UDP-N-acetyl-D-glucosamine dehydrogenase
MPEHVVRVLAEALDRQQGRGLNGALILVLGVAYKKNVDDIRESPSLRLMEMIEARGAVCDFYDPFVAQINETREYPTLNLRRGKEWDLETISAYDAVLIATDHDGLDYHRLADHARLIVDTRNACARTGFDLKNVVPA